jgi:predicted transcriptional regulator
MAKSLLNSEELLRMYREGIPQKDIAKHFNVTPAAICKKLKRLLPPPKSLENLTEKERKFAIEVSKGSTQTQAALKAFECGSLQSAKTIGSQLLDKEKIKMAIDELMYLHGLTRSYRIQRLKQHVDHTDPTVSLKGLDLSWKLDGSYAPEKHINLNVDYAALSKELAEIEAQIAVLEEELRSEGN